MNYLERCKHLIGKQVSIKGLIDHHGNVSTIQFPRKVENVNKFLKDWLLNALLRSGKYLNF